MVVPLLRVQLAVGKLAESSQRGSAKEIFFSSLSCLQLTWPELQVTPWFCSEVGTWILKPFEKVVLVLISGSNCASGNTSCKIILEFTFKKSQMVIKMRGCFEIKRPVLSCQAFRGVLLYSASLLSRMGLEGSCFLPFHHNPCDFATCPVFPALAESDSWLQWNWSRSLKADFLSTGSSLLERMADPWTLKERFTN